MIALGLLLDVRKVMDTLGINKDSISRAKTDGKQMNIRSYI